VKVGPEQGVVAVKPLVEIENYYGFAEAAAVEGPRVERKGSE